MVDQGDAILILSMLNVVLILANAWSTGKRFALCDKRIAALEQRLIDIPPGGLG